MENKLLKDDMVRQTAVIFEPVKLALDYRFSLPENVREVFVPVDAGVELSGLLYERSDQDYLMVYFQGNAKNLQNFLDNHAMVLNWGYNVLVTDYRSFGKSGGSLNGQEQLYADANAVFEYALGLGYTPDKIILYGYSMGVAMVAYLAAIREARAVIMESGYSSVDEMSFAAGLCPGYKLDNIEKAKRIFIPALVIHGELDEVITPDHAERIFESLASGVKQKYILRGGGHGDLRKRTDYQEIINDFIDHWVC